ncbi:aquaporin-8-like [Silurus meridionalis]|uniref:aquaporin-8-like n=1 Tax=Silurus meridionalis TaxID=175797 RepID=UPI001EEB1220|nr:aquaporin-8-like [Silurus meridionalis]KAI5097407.1 aquaporin 8a, tandem duplicate 1 [Silurus meridionalis]
MSTHQSKTNSDTIVRNSVSAFDIEPEEAETIIHRMVSVFQPYIQPCIAELVGSALFIFTGCMSVIENPQDTGSLQPALAHGLALSIVIALFGQISGGHFNPAVSVSVYLIGGLNIILLIPYILAQLCGGLIGAGLAKSISLPHNYYNASGGAFNTIQERAQIEPAIIAEMVMTLFLTMSVCMGAVNDKTRTLLAPFCIGLTVAADVLAGGAVSGACMNPARAFGPAAVANYWTYHWIYWVGPMTGALLTAILIRLMLGDEKIRVILK